MKCTNCNQIIPDGSRFCNYCGSKVVDFQGEHPIRRTVTIERPTHFFGVMTLYQVMCDGKVVASLRDGETKVLEIDGNPHTIQCCSISPTMIDGDYNGWVSGSGGMKVSDVISIPGGNKPVQLQVKPGFVSLTLQYK